jgi:hypothetical protein
MLILHHSITQNLFAILKNIDRQQQQQLLFSVMLRSIWKHTSNKIWNDTSDSSQTLCERAYSLLISLKNAQDVRFNIQAEQTMTTLSTWFKSSI